MTLVNRKAGKGISWANRLLGGRRFGFIFLLWMSIGESRRLPSGQAQRPKPPEDPRERSRCGFLTWGESYDDGQCSPVNSLFHKYLPAPDNRTGIQKCDPSSVLSLTVGMVTAFSSQALVLCHYDLYQPTTTGYIGP